jgi:hypothetical protein
VGSTFCTLARIIELVSCYSSDTLNFEVASRSSESLCTAVVGVVAFLLILSLWRAAQLRCS